MEYVAAQLDDDGVLVLSDRAGAHDLLGQHALSIDPTATDDFASTIGRAVSMHPTERAVRMHELRQQVAEHDLSAWVNEFLLAIDELA
ncbi:trehalose-6-phosphate synthase [Haloarculaceae archaeon H-GB2-1]|nr:trehalose-6-phosphate synthase [Haloarculaceae archaeon H-GB2-1]